MQVLAHGPWTVAHGPWPRAQGPGPLGQAAHGPMAHGPHGPCLGSNYQSNRRGAIDILLCVDPNPIRLG